MAMTRRQLLTTAKAALVTPLAAIGSVAYIARREASQPDETSIVVLDISSEDDVAREQYGQCAPILQRSTTIIASCEVRSTSTPPSEDDADERLTALVEVVRGVLLGPVSVWATDHGRVASRVEYRIGAAEADVPTALAVLAVDLEIDGIAYEAA